MIVYAPFGETLRERERMVIHTVEKTAADAETDALMTNELNIYKSKFETFISTNQKLPNISGESQLEISETGTTDLDIFYHDYLFDIKNQADAAGERVLDKLVEQKLISNDMIAHATAVIIGVPYVELKNIVIDQDILSRIPLEASSRIKAVPLGEKDGLLNVAMVDVTNVQATDYISNLINQPIRVWMSSERGIDEVLEQYHGDFSGVKAAVREG